MAAFWALMENARALRWAFLYKIPKIIWVEIKSLEKDFLETKDSAISELLLASTRKVVDEGLI